MTKHPTYAQRLRNMAALGMEAVFTGDKVHELADHLENSSRILQQSNLNLARAKEERAAATLAQFKAEKRLEKARSLQVFSFWALAVAAIVMIFALFGMKI